MATKLKTTKYESMSVSAQSEAIQDSNPKPTGNSKTAWCLLFFFIIVCVVLAIALTVEVVEEESNSASADHHCDELSVEYEAFGPFCWGNTCYTGDAKTACSSLGGEQVNDYWCVLNSQRYTLLGPFCYATSDTSSTCETGGASTACTQLKGTNIGNGRWCIINKTIDDVQYESFGPYCFQSTSSSSSCYTDAAQSACSTLGGMNVVNKWCILDALKYRSMGPFCRMIGSTSSTCYTGSAQTMCSNLNGTSVDNRWCIVRNEWN